MKEVIKLLIVLSIVLIPVSWSYAEDDFKQGQWEFSIVLDEVDDGTPSLPKTFTSCLSKKGDPIPLDEQESLNCEYGNIEMNGDLLVWSRACSDAAGIEYQTDAEIRFSGETLQGYLYTIINDPETGISDQSREITGKYIGPCKKDQ
jgi:hypothetical protein